MSECYNLNSTIYTHLGSLLPTYCSCINNNFFRREILIAIDCINYTVFNICYVHIHTAM